MVVESKGQLGALRLTQGYPTWAVESAEDLVDGSVRLLPSAASSWPFPQKLWLQTWGRDSRTG